MKFTCTVDIKAPLGQVLELHGDPTYFNKWQDGFISYKTYVGQKSEVGSKSKITLKGPGGEMELIETILENNLPKKYVALVEHKHMVNTITNSFIPVSDNITRWESTIEYTKFIGFMPKLMAILMPEMFKKQTQKWLNQFKEFVENEGMQL